MRKWWIGFVAAALVVGCGGGSTGGGTSGGGGGGGGGGSTFATNLGASTDVQFLFLTGDSRRSPGSEYAEMGLIRLQNGPGDVIPSTSSGTPIRAQLDGYTINSFNFSVTLPAGTNSKTFTEFPLRIDRIFDEQADGSQVQVFPAGGGAPFEVSPAIPVDVTLFPGRQVSLAVYLNNGSLWVDASGLNFDRTEFERENFDPISGKMNGYLADCVSFDISGMAAADKPDMNNGGKASRVYFSGDAIGLSNGFDTVGSFNMIFPATIDDGVAKPPVDLGGSIAPGTYTVVEADPRDPLGAGTITSLQGIWKAYTEVLSNTPDSALIVFPNSRLSNEKQVVLITKTGGVITGLWQGTATFAGSASATVELWPISQIRDASAANTGSGTLTTAVTSGGEAKSGTFTLTTTSAGMPTSGQFIVYMR